MYRARFIIAGALVALAVAALSVLALLPSYLALTIAAGASPAGVISPNASVQADRDAIQQTQSLFNTLSPLVSSTTTPTDALTAALTARPNGVSVDHFTYAAGSPGALMIFGSGDTPGDINAYRAALANDPHFTNVSVPVGDLVGAAGGQFSITASGNF